MLAYHYLKKDMTAGHGKEPAWKIGETRSLKGELIICEHAYHSSPSPAEGLSYLPGPMLCLVEIGKPMKQTAQHMDKYASRSRTLLKCVDMSVPLRLLMCDIADMENASYEAENPGRKVPVEALNSVLVGRKFATGEITQEEMEVVNRAAYATASYSSPFFSSFYSSSFSASFSAFSSSASFASFSAFSAFSSPRWQKLVAAYNKLALEALEKA